jgi:hypothetical protein
MDKLNHLKHPLNLKIIAYASMSIISMAVFLFTMATSNQQMGYKAKAACAGPGSDGSCEGTYTAGTTDKFGNPEAGPGNTTGKTGSTDPNDWHMPGAVGEKGTDGNLHWSAAPDSDYSYTDSKGIQHPGRQPANCPGCTESGPDGSHGRGQSSGSSSPAPTAKPQVAVPTTAPTNTPIPTASPTATLTPTPATGQGIFVIINNSSLGTHQINGVQAMLTKTCQDDSTNWLSLGADSIKTTDQVKIPATFLNNHPEYGYLIAPNKTNASIYECIPLPN